MKTLQEKYNAVLEGNFSKSQFVRAAKMEVPRFISPYNGFDDTVQILKNKGMLSEAKAETPEYDKPAPGYSLEALERGVDYELEKAGVDTATETATEDQYEKAKAKAEKNLDKDPNFYLHLLSGDSKNVDKHDREVEVDQKKLFKGTVDPKGGKAEGNTDTFNAMKKATLREAAMAKGYTEEQVEAAIKSLQEKKSKEVVEEQMYIDDDEFESEMVQDRVKEILPIINKSQYFDGEVPEETAIEFVKMHRQDIRGASDDEIAMEFDNFIDANPELIGNVQIKGLRAADDEGLREGDIKEAVKKVIKHILAEGALDRFSDYEPEISNRTETIQDILGELEQELDINIDIINGQISKTGGALSPAIQAATKKDLMDLVKSYVGKITYVKSQPVDIDGKKLHSIPSAEPLNERVGGLQDFISLIQDRAVDSEFPEEEEAIEVIEAIADHYGIKIQIGGFVGEENKTK